MTPQEKAKELVDKFSYEIRCSDFHIPEFITGVTMADGSPEYTEFLEKETNSLAKQCALIAVGEFLKWDFYSHGHSQKKYWQSVKTEIEKP